MRAMVLAAGLGTRLRPLTYELPKPMVPVLDRPVMAHIVDLLDRHGYEQVIANLHYFPETIRSYFGDRIVYREEPELLGTAGGVRNCADFLIDGGEPFLIISGDALTDIDLGAFVARHKQAGGIGTLAVKRVQDTREFGVVLHDKEGRITGFQEKPDLAEALSDLGNCGIYLFEPEIFDYFPQTDFVDWANDVFPALLANDVPFHIHPINEYWNDVGSLHELKEGTFDALRGELRVEVPGEEVAEGVRVCEGTSLDGAAVVEAPVWVGRNVSIGADARLQGPLVIGDNVTIGEGAALKDAIVLPGSEVAPHTILIGAITGSTGIVERLRPRGG
jgi:mannose-1-phosphate guanylyltransferase